MSEQRVLIKKVIYTSCSHMTADQIYQTAKKEMPSLALGTVYRNLNLMTQDGEIRKVAIPGGPDRYDKNISPHEHMQCVRCGELEDIMLPELMHLLNQKTEGKILSYDLQINYLCPACAQQEKVQ